jgi:hypothetical protein
MSNRGGSFRGRPGGRGDRGGFNRGGSNRGGGRGQAVYREKKTDTDTTSEKKTPENKPEKQVTQVYRVKEPKQVTAAKDAPEVKVGEKKATFVKKYGSGDANVRTKGRIRDDNGSSARKFNDIKGGWQPKADVPVLPKFGANEEVLAGHYAAIHNVWDRDELIKLGQNLSDEGTRPELVRTVGEQLIRQELNDMVAGGNLKSLANIKVNGRIMSATNPADATVQRLEDRKVSTKDGFTDDEVALWNNSRQDAEVDTIRDIQAWAAKVDLKTLAGQEIDLQIIGNGGPCESCQKRLELMAKDIMADWKRRGQLTDDQLPRLRLTSYYAYKSKKFPRNGLTVRDGWDGDNYDPNLTFTNKTNNGKQPVFVHPMITLGPQPAPQAAITTTVSNHSPDDKAEISDDEITTAAVNSPEKPQDSITTVTVIDPTAETKQKENVS